MASQIPAPPEPSAAAPGLEDRLVESDDGRSAADSPAGWGRLLPPVVFAGLVVGALLWVERLVPLEAPEGLALRWLRTASQHPGRLWTGLALVCWGLWRRAPLEPHAPAADPDPGEARPRASTLREKIL